MKPKSKTVRLGKPSANASVSNAMDQAQDWIKEAIQKTTKEQVEKLIKESMGSLEYVDVHADRKIFVSRFTEREKQIEAHYRNVSRTPLNNFYPYNPLAAAQDFSGGSVTNPNEIQLENLMDISQLSECADAFFADGVLRSIISKHIDFVLPDKTKCTVTVDKTWEENKSLLGTDSALVLKEIDKPKIAEYNIRVSRLMERLHFWDNEIKLMVTSIIFGRNGLFITREKPDKVYHKFGKPTSLTLLNPLNIKKARVSNETSTKGQFDGFIYDWGIKDRTNDILQRINLIPFFYDDFNIYKNTYFSGMTRIFSLIGIAHSNQLINSYDLPEATKTQYSNTSFVYAGQQSALLAQKFARKVKAGTNVHDQPNLRVDEAHAAKQIIDILQTRDKNYEALCNILGLPIFLLFSNSTNFATAAIAMQSYINGTVHRLGTFFMDTLEEYFFLPLLSDICNIEIETLLDDYVHRAKAIKPPVDLQTKTDRIDNACKMWDRGIITSISTFLKYCQEDTLAALAEPLDKMTQELKEAQIKADIEEQKTRIDNEGMNPNNPFLREGNGQSIKSETQQDMRMTATEAGKRLLTNFAGTKTGSKRGPENLNAQGEG